MKCKLTIKVLLLLFIALIYSCDFFAPYDPQFLDISAEKINFGLFENEKEFVISYKDSFAVNWEIDPTVDWIEITPMNGAISIDKPDTVTVKLNRNGLTPGLYESEIFIKFRGTNTESLKLSMEIKPIINISCDSLLFGINDSLGIFNISNNGNYPLNWKVTSYQNWIRVLPDKGKLNIDSSKFAATDLDRKLTKSMGDTSITVKINKSELSEENNSGIIEIQTEAGKDSIKIFVLKATPALMEISTNKINFEQNIVTQKINVINLGDEILYWRTICNASWIKTNPISGSSRSIKNNEEGDTKNYPTEVEVSIDRTGLPPGIYNSNFEIKSNGGNEVVEISMEVPESPTLSVSQTLLEFIDPEIIKPVQISNTGNGELIFTASSSESWLTISPAKGTVTGRNLELNISVLRIGLQPGDYYGNVVINSNGGNLSIPIKMVVAQQLPQLWVSQTSLSYSDDNNESSFDIQNTGDGELLWQLNTDQTWIEIPSKSGKTGAKSKHNVKIKINKKDLSPGNYSGNIIISSNGGSENIKVSLNIKGDAKLSVNPNNLNFRNGSTAESIELKNTGDGDLTWQASSDKSWIIINKSSGTISARQQDKIEINIQSGDLRQGNYFGNIIISSNGGSENIKVSLNIKGDAKLSVTPNNLNFRNGSTSESIELKNSGDGDLTWQASSDKSWIIINKTSGTISARQKDEIEINIQNENLNQGDYSGNIIISSNGGSENIKVSLNIKGDAKLSVSPNNLNFRNGSTAESIELKNIGDGDLTWQASSDKSWIIINKTSGTISARQQDKIEINIQSGDLSQGDYSGNIIISSNGGSENIKVSLNIKGDAKLSVNPNSLNFRNGSTSESIELKNTGDGDLTWQASSDKSWITINKTSGTISARQQDKIEINIQSDDLSQGDYSGNIIISSNGGSENIKVSLNIKGDAKLSVTPNNLNFRNGSTAESIELKNTGDGDLTWQASSDKSWITINKTSGAISARQQDKIEINIQSGDLSQGDYSGNIIISSNGGSENIKVSLNIKGDAKLSVSPNSLNFRNGSTSESIELKNTGDGDLTWQASSDKSWIIINKSSGTISARQQDKIEINIQSGDLNQGDYSGNIIISSNGGSENIKVSLNIKGDAKLSVSPNNLNFRNGRTSESIELKNIGDGDLTWQASSDKSWITINKTSGTISARQQDKIEINIQNENLNQGDYSGSIIISSNGGNEVIDVSVKIDEKPKLNLSDNKLDFDRDTNIMSFSIQNGGGGQLNWKVEENLEPWVNVAPLSGSVLTEVSTVVVTINRSLIPAHKNKSAIKISSNGGDRSITVSAK